ncbi:MAG: glycosyltransferase [Myxococcota bacterium]
MTRGHHDREIRVLATGFGAVPGTNAHAAALLALATAVRAEVDLVCRKDAGLAHQSRVGPARLFRVPASGPPGEAMAGFARAVRRQLEAGSYDAVHVRGAAEGVAVAPLVAAMGSRLIYEVGTFADAAAPGIEQSAWSRDHAECLAAAHLVLVGGATAAAALAGRELAGEVRVLPPGVDVDTFDRCDAAPAPRARLLFLGTFTADRALGTVLAALREVSSIRPLRALFAGEPEPARRRELRLLASAFGLDDVVEVAGEPRPLALPAILAAADVVVVPAAATPRYEELGALPELLLEAMACGRPVVAAQVPAVAEVARDEVEALLYPPGEENTLAECVLTLLREPALAARLGDAAHARVRAGWGSAARRRRLVQLYEGLFPGSQRRDPWVVGFGGAEARGLGSSPSSVLRGLASDEGTAPEADPAHLAPDTVVGAPAPTLTEEEGPEG